MLKKIDCEKNCDTFLDRVVGGSPYLDESLVSLTSMLCTLESSKLSAKKDERLDMRQNAECEYQLQMSAAADTRDAGKKAFITGMVLSTTASAASVMSVHSAAKTYQNSSLKI